MERSPNVGRGILAHFILALPRLRIIGGTRVLAVLFISRAVILIVLVLVLVLPANPRLRAMCVVQLVKDQPVLGLDLAQSARVEPLDLVDVQVEALDEPVRAQREVKRRELDGSGRGGLPGRGGRRVVEDGARA